MQYLTGKPDKSVKDFRCRISSPVLCRARETHTVSFELTVCCYVLVIIKKHINKTFIKLLKIPSNEYLIEFPNSYFKLNCLDLMNVSCKNYQL